MPAFSRNQAFASTLFRLFLLHWFRAIRLPLCVELTTLRWLNKSPFPLSLSAYIWKKNPSSCQCVVKVPLDFVSVLTDLPASFAVHSVRALSLGRVLNSCLYEHRKTRTERRAQNFNSVTQPICFFVLFSYPYKCTHILCLWGGRSTKQTTRISKFSFCFIQFWFVLFTLYVYIYISFAGMYSILDSTTGGVQQWWYIIGIHLVDLCASPVLEAHDV